MMQMTEHSIPVNIEEEMRRSYMDYAMSVIIGRALPDVRDGMKPVHRRILYAMYELGNTWSQPNKKSARIVGDVIGKYHPHGDSAVYDALVRLAQTFTIRYPLVDGQGNFGSIDGDPPAAMRYTEVRMSRLASELMEEISKETVDFIPNYDETLNEPCVLPARFPNLLLNGSSGIAVGMATNIPPHNLNELIEGIRAIILNPDISIDELIHHIPGPDFPTAGYIHGKSGIYSAYKTGRGHLQLRARYLIEHLARNDRMNIVVTEIPYQVNKAKIIEQIVDLVRSKKIEGISDVRDESDRDGIRILIELSREASNDVRLHTILNNLYKHTSLQSTFSIILLAIDKGQPKLLNLKEILINFIEHRKDVVRRRTTFDLNNARSRAHILEGLKIALEYIDLVIEVIKKSKNPQEAREQLVARFDLSKKQAQAILDMRLQRLTALERNKIVQDLAEVHIEIKKYERILGDEFLLLNLILDELEEIKRKYGNPRRTEIIEETKEIDLEDLIVDEDMVVTISHGGYIKRNPISLYRSQRRGGRGITGMKMKEEDFVEDLFIASTHHFLLFFTDKGRVYWLKVYQIPEAGRASRGKAIVNVLNLSKDENIVACLPVKDFEEGKFIATCTCNGMVKKTPLEEYKNLRSNGIIGLLVREGDRLISAAITDGQQDIFLGTKNGLSIRFNEKMVRPMGRSTHGVRGIKLDSGDEVVSMEVLYGGTTLLSVTENGYGKRTRTEEYRVQSRGGRGLITIKTCARDPKCINGKVVAVRQVTDEEDLMLITNTGRIIRMRMKEISTIGRNTQGVKLVSIDPEETVCGVARLAEKDDHEEESDNST